jgi:hypothetical protein
MVIEKILKQLTPERKKKEIESIKNIKLPKELQEWVKRYEKVGKRDNLIWLLTWKIIKTVSLSNVSTNYQKSLQNIKFMITMFVIMLDDIVDKNKNKELLNELSNIPFCNNYEKNKNLTLKETKYIEFIEKVWDFIASSIRKYPRYKEFREFFYYDLSQIFNSMDFSLLVNKYYFLINKTEYWAYFSCSMQAMIYTDLHLMCDTKFKTDEFGRIREVIWKAQNMTRIGNWLNTWEREIKEKDYTSGVFAYAIDLGILTTKELKEESEIKVVDKIKNSNIEKKLLNKWDEEYEEIKKIDKKIKSIDAKKFLAELESLMIINLSLKDI